MNRYAYRLRSMAYKAADALYTLELRAHGVELGDGVRAEGRANIQRLNGRIRLGDGTILRSRDFHYHAHILPAKLLTDGPDALISIGRRCRLNGVVIHAQREVTIGDDCYIASGTAMLDSDGHVLDAAQRIAGVRDTPRPIRIGNRVWIGLNVLVLKGVTVGDDAVIGAGSVVVSDLPERSVCGGQPARVLRTNA